MEQNEKILIENLFNRLENVEKKSSMRDVLAEKLIKDLLVKQDNAPYYMTQIILVQEEAIKKLNERIGQLETEISLMQEKEKKNSTTSFLSGLFGSNNTGSTSNNKKNTWGNTAGKQDGNTLPMGSTAPTGNIGTIGGSPSNNNVSSFLGSALQTATGVAGGIVMGNMLMNLFQHKNSGEDLFNNVNSSSITNLDSHLDNHDVNSHYIHQNHSNIHEDNNTDLDHDDIDTDSDISDDSNFI